MIVCLFVCLFVSSSYKKAELLLLPTFEHFDNSEMFDPDNSMESHMGLHTTSHDNSTEPSKGYTIISCSSAAIKCWCNNTG